MALRLLFLLASVGHAVELRGFRCVFFHGAGWGATTPSTNVDTDGFMGHSGYWGGNKIEDVTPYCDSRLFVHQDTKHRGWDDAEMQQAFCDAALGDQNQSTKVIDYTLIFAHSMGNSIFAAALLNNRCSMGPRAKWYALSAIWGGSEASRWLVDICHNDTSTSMSRTIALDMGYCSNNMSDAVPEAYISMAPGYPGLDALVEVASAHVSGGICGTSATGLISLYSVALGTLSGEVGFNGTNDGMVSIGNCELPGHNYNPSYKSQFYLAAINHADSTCQDGDGYWGEDRQPCHWYLYLQKQLIEISDVISEEEVKPTPALATAWYAAKPPTWRCVFLHGAGWGATTPSTTVDTDGFMGHSGYWGAGKIVDVTPYCSSRLFVHQDTKHRGWDNVELQQAFCDAALGEQNQSTTVIDDTIIFAHSMGNSIFAAALLNNRCSMGPRAKWYALSAIWGGSEASRWLVDICHNVTSTSASRAIALDMGYCSNNMSDAVPEAYISMAPGYPGLDALVEVASAHVSGGICGASATGLIGLYSLALGTLSGEVGFNETNDGMVSIGNCELPGHNYNPTYKSQFYLAAINHADSTCQDGDGYWGVNRQPCHWYLYLQKHLLASSPEVAIEVVI